jgi:tetratricopeptide (TPR) repeat protein
MADVCVFISYSTADALEFARRLADELEGGEDNFIDVWFDKRNIDPARDWDDQIVDGIRSCRCMAFVMTKDSTAQGSMCKNEWTWALKYKKVVIPIRLHKDAEQPFGLGNRQWIDFTGEFEHGLAKLRKFLREMDSPEGILQSYKDRLADAERALRRAKDDEENRITTEIEDLKAESKRQEKIVKNPKAAEEKTEKNIQNGLERERQPEEPVAGKSSTRFINPPPGIAPNYFQDRLIETQQIANFLDNDSQRLMTIVGRAGVGKTAMVCRLLKALERGELPDDLSEMKVDGIVYLSETGSHRVNFANVFADLSKLLPKETAESLEGIYRNPQTSTGDKMRTLLDAFPSGRVILLLDNFETLIDPESLNLRDNELSDALNALLGGQHHAVKAVITTRIAPRDLAISEPGRQHHLSLDEGLESPYAENVLREMDADGRVGLKTAPDALLNKAREKTRGYPRALEALYAILSVDRYTTLEELLEISLPHEVVQKLVGEAFNRLDPSAQKVMQALAVYNRPVSPAAIDYLLQPHLPSIDSALVLNRLVNMHFARREAGRYYLHPADKEYAFSIIPEGEKNVEEDGFFPKPRTDFTRYCLLTTAANYFAQVRIPRTEWKDLNDLSAPLAEFDMRCAVEDYDTAAKVLSEIDFDYLLLWSHYRLAFDMYLFIRDKIKDDRLRLRNLYGLGTAYRHIGKTKEAVSCLEQGLAVSHKIKDRGLESAVLCALGTAYSVLGEVHKSVGIYKQALIIAQEIGDRNQENNIIGNLGNRYVELGEIRMAIECHERGLVIAREIKDKYNEGNWLSNLGKSFAAIGEIQKAIQFNEEALVVIREINNRIGEMYTLGRLGDFYTALGDENKAIEFYEQAIAIADEISYRHGESGSLACMGQAMLNMNIIEQAIQNYTQAIHVADDISFPRMQVFARWGLAQAYLSQDDFFEARATIETALQYDVPEYNHDATTLYGIIALRQGKRETAKEAFAKSIAQADEILAKTPDYYDALDAKGLALCGLALCGSGRPSASIIDDAIETFRAARKIAPHVGVVKSVLRLFDELVKCDEEGLLKDVRKATEGI